MFTEFENRLRAARDTLPTPDSTVTAAAEQHILARLPAAIGEPRRLRMPRRRRFVGVAALVAAALLVGGFAGAELAGPSRGATSTPVTSFQPALGWNTLETNVLSDSRQPEVLLAANVPFKPFSPESLFNSNSPNFNSFIKSLPSDGIVIVVFGPSSIIGTPDNSPYSLRLPPKLSDFHFFSDNYEGQVAPNVSYYYIWAHLNETEGWEGIDIEVLMGRNDPTPTMKAAADEELARLTLPPPTTTTTSVTTTTSAP